MEPSQDQSHIDRDAHDRFTVDPMYSAVTVSAGHGPAAEPKAEGHIYEVSLAGLRLELDIALPVGSPVTVAMSLPGCAATIEARGRVSHVFDEVDDPAARRMVVDFETFADGARAKLARYLDQKWLRPAPAHHTLAGERIGAADAHAVVAADPDAQQTCEVMIETTDAGSKSSDRRKSASAA